MLKVVSKLPFSKLGLKDKLIWEVSKNGKYTARSAYHLEVNLKKRATWESSVKVNNRRVWQNFELYKLQIVSKFSCGGQSMVLYLLS